MSRISLARLSANLDHLVDRAAAGEELVITRRGRAVARLVPLAPVPMRRVFGAMRGEVQVPQGFFDPLPEDELKGWL